DTATGELATAVSSAWRGHRQSVFAGETPTQIRGKLALTKANEEALEVYKMKYSLLKAAFESFPEDIAAIEKVGKIAGELEKAAKAFDFNVPSEVKSFLEAVQSVKGAPLNLLTQTVQDWIEENGGSDSYSIRATGRE
ncbi:hypothetical protein, partial [Sneathiella sp.]|uniref:hypothetical protein n=1 Tax=Sneathiella sp. TaxID=1964365 RepID=UPI003565BF1D